MGEMIARLEKAWALASRMKSAWFARCAKKALSSFWTLALKPDSMATTRTEKSECAGGERYWVQDETD